MTEENNPAGEKLEADGKKSRPIFPAVIFQSRRITCCRGVKGFSL
jgi:hypothetical protein